MTSRAPISEFEKRVDFEAIAKAQDKRHQETVAELQELLRRIERATLRWVDQELATKKLKTAVGRWKMPMPGKYREIIRRRMTAAFNRGVSDVAGEVALKKPRVAGRDLSRARAQADALVDGHIARLEADLKAAWAKAMFGNIDRGQLRYVTQKVFSDFAGWPPPEVS